MRVPVTTSTIPIRWVESSEYTLSQPTNREWRICEGLCEGASRVTDGGAINTRAIDIRR